MIGLDLLLYRHFIMFLREPFDKSLGKEKEKYNTVESLYYAYKNLPKGTFKLTKMRVKSWHKPEIISQSVDFFIKLILSLTIASAGVATTILIATLSVTNSNSALQQDQSTWLNSISHILKSLTEGMDLYKSLFYIGTMVFLLIFGNILISHGSTSVHKKHLIVIEEIEKEYGQK